MVRPTLLGGVLAILLAPLSVGINSLMIPKEDPQLSASLRSLSETLISFEQRQSGSEDELTKQIQALTGVVAETQKASVSQIDSLAGSLAEVRSVALKQASDKVDFASLLNEFSKGFEEKLDAKVATLVKAEVEESRVGTLDVSSDPADADDLESIQTIRDAARRIVALEKEVAALKSRSSVGSPASSAVYYQPYPSSGYAVSGGSTGSVASYGSTGSSVSYGSTGSAAVYQSSSAYPVESYSYSSYPVAQGTTTVRRPFLSNRTSRQCRMVNGRIVCN